MKNLSLVTIIFLPISFLAGVFGTNFVDFPGEILKMFYWKSC